MTSRTLLLLTATVLGLAAARPARACSVCGCGDPMLAITEAAGMGGDLQLGVQGEALTMTAGSDEAPGVLDRLSQQTVRAIAAYSPGDYWNLSLQIPIVHKRLVSDDAGVTTVTSDLTGLGDVELGARVFVFDAARLAERRRDTVAVSVGTSLPTGASDTSEGGVRIDQHGQLGTGAFGPYVGLLYRVRKDPFGAYLTATVRYRTENSYNYRFGWAVLWAAEGQYEPTDWAGVALAIEGRRAAADTAAGETVGSTGGTVVAVSPSAHVRLLDVLWLGARVQVPAVVSLYGQQKVGPTYLLDIQVKAL